MYQIIGEIEGVAPILFSRFFDPNSTEAPGGGRPTKGEREEEVKRRVHRDDSGIFLPKWSFKQCLLQGCGVANLKEGRRAMAPFLEATVFPNGHLYFGKDEPDEILETWGRRPPRTGGACVVRYPSFKTGWKLRFAMTVVDDRRSQSHIRKALEEGGLLVGLGSWRPEYGRFIVTDWQVKSQ